YNERALSFLDIPTRLAGLLLSFLDVYGESSDGGIRLRAPITYEMLARCLGATQRSVERAMGGWLAEGWVWRAHKRLWFSSVAELEARADPDRITLFHKLGL